MRRIVVLLSAFILASLLVSFAALAAGAQTTPQQYANEDPAQQESAADPEVSASESSPSQGSFTDGNASPEELSRVEHTPPTTAESRQVSAQGRGRASGRDVVRAAKRYLGTRYKFGACTKSRMSCTCLTKKAWAKFGHKLPMTEEGQWRYKRGRSVPKSALKPGDIVFFKEGGGGITHVGIYAGGKNDLVHASNYFNKVVASEMKHVHGYFGAIRLRPR